VLGVTSAKAVALWSIMREKFDCSEDGRWRNARLEVERTKQGIRQAALRSNGARGGRPKNQTLNQTETNRLITTEPEPNQTETQRFAKPEPKHNLNKSLSSSSSSSSSFSFASHSTDLAAKTDRTRSLIVSPLEFERAHGKHVREFCDWLCFPQSVFDEFVRLVIAVGSSEPEAIASVTAWGQSVRQEWQRQGRIPGDNIFEFWRHAWKATHGSNKPPGGAIDVLGGLRQVGRP
jgi:uncharacterized protein YdaU (DUF1376 family)